MNLVYNLFIYLFFKWDEERFERIKRVGYTSKPLIFNSPKFENLKGGVLLIIKNN